ncbi:hypothetical protein FA15DRAFT_594414 [Coprinopsis marcescibilis]|uniref:Uncharacterized protein n=1 Tax=Coprinopsis marcescibilis TaxID=230819 RepID=A0A5C3KSU6_COPMA|nr:hypothetical protein FA15DRAFT_594414 [Coprinopsis marcescibilis]
MSEPTVTPLLDVPHALYPLTHFDYLFETTTFVTGWLVEGDIDRAALEVALRAVTEKWRMLSGRIHSIQPSENKWFIRIPLGTLPPDYETFSLTSSTSEVPLSTYVFTPLSTVSPSLPLPLFVSPSTPRGYNTWEKGSHPLTFWHLTYFPASSNNGTSYTTIGFARSHGVFDGTGASQVTKALVAELKGEVWTPPPLPVEGFNTNLIADELTAHLAENPELPSLTQYKGYKLFGNLRGFVRFALWQLKEKWWGGAERRILLLPKDALDYIVQDVRRALAEGGQKGSQVSSGDVLVAWLYKTIYASGVSGTTSTHITNYASIRGILSNELKETSPKRAASISTYPHNGFIPLPYPTFPASHIQSTPLHTLTHTLSQSRQSLNKSHITSAYHTLTTHIREQPYTAHPDAYDELLISNVSSSRILETDWSLVGAKKTLCGYRYNISIWNLLVTNAVYIAGRLKDGSVVLDLSLNSHRMKLLVDEVERVNKMATVGDSGKSK